MKYLFTFKNLVTETSFITHSFFAEQLAVIYGATPLLCMILDLQKKLSGGLSAFEILLDVSINENKSKSFI